jgi:hypothetical protein
VECDVVALHSWKKEKSQDVTGGSISARGHGSEERDDLLVNLTRMVDRKGDFFAKQLPVTGSVSMCGDPYSALGEPERGPDLSVRWRQSITLERGPEEAEQAPLSRRFCFGLEPLDDAFEQRQCPLPLEEPFGSQIMRRIVAVSLFGLGRVEAELLDPATAFDGQASLTGVRKIVRRRGSQERAQAALRTLDGLQVASREKLGDESLHQVLSIFAPVAPPSDHRIDGKPIKLAERLERGAGLG